MSPSPSFAEVLDAADQLPTEDQEALVAVIRRRLADAGRARVVADAREAEAEFAAGNLKPASVDDIMKEILS